MYNLTTWDTSRPTFISQHRLTKHLLFCLALYSALLNGSGFDYQVTERIADCTAKVQVTFYAHILNHLLYLTIPITKYLNNVLNSIIFLLSYLLPTHFSLCKQFCFTPAFPSSKIYHQMFYQSDSISCFLICSFF